MRRVVRSGSLAMLLLLVLAQVALGEAKDLLEGAKPQYAAGAKGGDWKSELPFTEEGRVTFRVQYAFELKDLPDAASLTLVKPDGMEKWTLNGKPVPLPLEGMRYRANPGIPTSLLVAGKNVLEGERNFDVRKGRGNELGKADVPAKLLAIPAADLDFVSGPVLCGATADSLSIYAKTNIPATVTVEVAGKSFASSAGIYHAIKATGLAGGECQYTLTAKAGSVEKKVGPFATQTLPTGDKFVFAAMGDSRSRPREWASVAAAALAAKPMLTIFSGDMVSSGRADALWDVEFFGVAKDYFAAVPTFFVLGNHEENTPLFGKYLETPATTKNWSVVAGPVLFIGIDPDLNWEEKGENYQWMEKLLAASTQKYIFVVGHAPPYTSGPHGKIRPDGVPEDRGIANGRKYIMPLLQKYKATAVFAGHDHCYERSEPPENVTVIVTGGAGAPLYDKVSNAAEQNPYSKCFVRSLHVCVLSVDGDTCTMRVLDPAGKELDKTQWKARNVAGK